MESFVAEPSPTESMGESSILRTDWLLIGLSIGMIILLVLAAAILTLLVYQRRCDRTPRSPAETEVRPIRLDQVPSPDGNPRASHFATYTSPAPVEMGSTSSLVRPVENRHQPEAPQVLISGGLSPAWGTSGLAWPLHEDNRNR